MPKSKEFVDSESSGSESDEPKAKKSKKTSKAETKKYTTSKDGTVMFELGNMKYATISQFKGKKYVGIREYYTDANDELKPGKKGIALNAEQWAAFKDSLDDV